MQAFERPCGGRLGQLMRAAELQTLNQSARFVFRNVEWDGRVPLVRQRHFEDELDSLHKTNPHKIERLGDALQFFKKHRVDRSLRSDDIESFMNRGSNGSNEVQPGVHWCQPPESLGTIVNLSWLTAIFFEAKRLAHLPFHDFPDGHHLERAWFDKQLMGVSPDQRHLFFDRVFARIHHYRQQNGLKPVWVAEWSRIEEVLRLQPDDWLHLVGCHADSTEPQLILALRYTAADGMPPLFRPSQLESGDNPLHFPVPGNTDVHCGGFAVNHVRNVEIDNKYECSREWIHAPFRWRPEFVQTWAWTNPSKHLNTNELLNRRQAHSAYIRRRLSAIPTDWMPSLK